MINFKNKFFFKENVQIFFIGIICIFFDLYSKYLAKIYLEKKDIEIFYSFKFHLAFNEGIAFSIPITGIFQILMTFTFLGFFLFYFYKNLDLGKFYNKIAIGFVLGGAIGNLYERILFSKVTDFIAIFDFFPIFNLADSFVFLGISILIISEFFLRPMKK